MKKAQIEIMGLVMIVILVTIGMFISFALSNKPTEEKTALSVYSDEQLATNYLITLLETNMAHSDLKMHDLAVDCMRIKTTQPPAYDFGALDSCEQLANITEYIVNGTLDRWPYNYNFSYTYTDVHGNINNIFNVTYGACRGAQSSPGWQPISLYRVTTAKAAMQLNICIP